MSQGQNEQQDGWKGLTAITATDRAESPEILIRVGDALQETPVYVVGAVVPQGEDHDPEVGVVPRLAGGIHGSVAAANNHHFVSRFLFFRQINVT